MQQEFNIGKNRGAKEKKMIVTLLSLVRATKQEKMFVRLHITN